MSYISNTPTVKDIEDKEDTEILKSILKFTFTILNKITVPDFEK